MPGSKKLFFSFLIFSLGSLSAQTHVDYARLTSAGKVEAVSGTAPVKILAVMVEFQKDTDNNTVGDGSFGSIYAKNYGDKIIDPLPHDSSYFASHLEFVKNYYSKVSKGKVTVSYDILPQIVTVSKTMRNYSPPVNSTDFSSMADFVKEVWTSVSVQNPNFNFGNYNLFAIFHAGVGRDISLPGSLGNEKDLPSVYLGLPSLQKYFGASFDGVQVGSSGFKITNTMILPQAENREITSFGQTVLFQVSINGLITANVASFMGLPDLFDTNTGLSAIGKFGLMDGQAIFANRGLFPPEPSAWEKIYLGWETPTVLEVKPQSAPYVIHPSLDAAHTIYRVPINSTEYYLVEYRQRDYNSDGLILTVKNNGVTSTKSFLLSNYAYLEAIPDSLINGVITDVDEFDYSLPGSGILIWHIDEKVINEKLADNKINADKTRRGVDLEEADGVQDIGVPYTTVLGDQLVGEGTELDLWYSTNPAKLYKNIFSKNTRPNTNANDGANSLITFKDFSTFSDPHVMSFELQYGDDAIKPLFKIAMPKEAQHHTLNSFTSSTGEQFFLLGLNSDFYTVDKDGLIKDSLLMFSSVKPLINGTTLVGLYNPILAGDTSKINWIDLSSGSLQLFSQNYQNRFSTSPVLDLSSKVFAGDSLGNIAQISQSSFTLNNLTGSPITQISGQNSNAVLSGDKYFYDNSGNYASITIPGKLLYAAGTTDNSNNKVSAILSETGFYILDKDNRIINQFSTQGKPTTFSVADLKNEASNYILYANNTNVEAYNLAGSCAENFPFKDPMGIGFVTSPLAAYFDALKRTVVMAVTLDGRIFAIDGLTGKTVTGFPISTGQTISVTPLLYKQNGVLSVAVMNKSSFSAFNISSAGGTIYWGEENGNMVNNAFVSGPLGISYKTDFFPKAKVYNWPNPVNEGSTHIRYYVSEDSKINIKIFDLAGDYVAELTNTALGGMGNETPWNVSNIQSGIYFAHVEATGTSGKTESAIIKIAVVK